MSIGRIIAKKREELGLSQTDLAKKAGLKPPTISQYESGVRSPSYEALIKLSNALGVTTDFLITGEGVRCEIFDPQTKMLINIFKCLSYEQKEQLLKQAVLISNQPYISEWPILNGPADYADYVLKKFSETQLPIDVFSIAKKLNIKVLIDDIGEVAEGILYKGENNIIVLNSNLKNVQRRKFTLAILIGHSIIPWHVQLQYSRKKGSTLLTDNIQDVEANRFAAALIMPKSQLERDFIKNSPTWESIKELAQNKYDVSAFALANSLVDLSKEHFAIIQSKDWMITKSYQGIRPLKDKIHPNSKAASFFEKTSENEEMRNGFVPAEYWIDDAKPNETIYEDSIYNPLYGSVLTLLFMK